MKLHLARSAGAALLLLGFTLIAAASPPSPFTARDGLDLAADAAHAWAPDARLVYVENDEDADTEGAAARWGYLFFSEQRGRCRAYSLERDRIRQARDLDFVFDAPPLPMNWVDSGAAVAGAEAAGGAEYRERHGGRLSSVILLRGAFHPDRPDMSTWTLIYHAEGVPSLTVLLDAADGEAIRTWEG